MFSRKVVPISTVPKLTVSISQSEKSWVNWSVAFCGDPRPCWLWEHLKAEDKFLCQRPRLQTQHLRSILNWFWFWLCLVSLLVPDEEMKLCGPHLRNSAHRTRRVTLRWLGVTRLLIQGRTLMWPMNLEQTHWYSHLRLTEVIWWWSSLPSRWRGPCRVSGLGRFLGGDFLTHSLSQGGRSWGIQKPETPINIWHLKSDHSAYKCSFYVSQLQDYTHHLP